MTFDMETKKQDKILEEVRNYADRAHGDQMRKYIPTRYIVHPIRVMELCKTRGSDVTMLAAALLHDVLEDTPVKPDDMRRFLHGIMNQDAAEQTLSLVIELTDVYVRADYPRLNRKQRKAKETERMAKISAKAQTIKYADIIDNGQEIVQHDRDFARVFLRECNTLLQVMQKGDDILRKKALEVIEEGFRILRK